MGWLDPVTRYLADHQVPMRTLQSEYPTIETQFERVTRTYAPSRPWRAPSISEALGVPSIQRCVTLISGAVGSLTIQGYRNGVLMPKTPPVLARPNPYDTPQAFYRDSGWNMSTRGEVVWFIASFDGDGRPAALVVVPLHELGVEGTSNRLRPKYTWGDVTSTRYSPATPDGRFIHVFYARNPGDLRGSGPLQMTQAATSVSVEAQEWAANFYSRGGASTVELHSDEELESDEANDLKDQWSSNPPNVPQVTSGGLNALYHDINPQGAQMLDARAAQNGEAARAFGVPGALLEFSAPGSSMTYQNIGEVFTMFVRACLAIKYLEPMEQALSDILPGSTAARFNTEGFYRADAKTRWEVYKLATEVIGPDEAAVLAREREGLAAGDVEFRPIPFAPPAVVPRSLPIAAGGVRCDGMRTLHGQLEPCGALLAESGVFVGTCRRCKKEYRAA